MTGLTVCSRPTWFRPPSYARTTSTPTSGGVENSYASWWRGPWAKPSPVTLMRDTRRSLPLSSISHWWLKALAKRTDDPAPKRLPGGIGVQRTADRLCVRVAEDGPVVAGGGSFSRVIYGNPAILPCCRQSARVA